MHVHAHVWYMCGMHVHMDARCVSFASGRRLDGRAADPCACARTQTHVWVCIHVHGRHPDGRAAGCCLLEGLAAEGPVTCW